MQLDVAVGKDPIQFLVKREILNQNVPSSLQDQLWVLSFLESVPTIEERPLSSVFLLCQWLLYYLCYYLLFFVSVWSHKYIVSTLRSGSSSRSSLHGLLLEDGPIRSVLNYFLLPGVWTLNFCTRKIETTVL